jgi:hypothetical protein
MRGICELGGSYDGRLEIELIEGLDRDRCLARLRLMARAWDAEREQWSWEDREHLELERMLLRTDALVAFAEALKTWAALPLDRLRLPSFTYETELARGWPERVSIAVGPPPRYTLGDRALLEARVIAGGRETRVAFAVDVSGAAVFAEDVGDAVQALGARGRRTR